MNQQERARFDALVEAAIEALPDRYEKLLAEVPVVVEDEPSDELIEMLIEDGVVEAEERVRVKMELCGLHTGVSLTERSVEHVSQLPDQIMLFRRGIVAAAGGWGGGEGGVEEQVRVTLLHELGHHVGLDEDDLDELGYG